MSQVEKTEEKIHDNSARAYVRHFNRSKDELKKGKRKTEEQDIKDYVGEYGVWWHGDDKP